MMKYFHLIVSAFCTFATIQGFDAGTLDALNGWFAVINFGVFVDADRWYSPAKRGNSAQEDHDGAEQAMTQTHNDNGA